MAAMKQRRRCDRLVIVAALFPFATFLLLIPSRPRDECLKYIAYDHVPPSPAHPSDLADYLSHKNRTLITCGENCTSLITSICSNEHPPVSLAGRLGPAASCLRDHYKITTTQPPPAYYLGSKLSSQSFYEYLEQLKGECRLLDHYDGLGVHCADDTDVYERVERIRERFDEVLDLADGAGWASRVWSVLVDQPRGIGRVARLRAEWRLYKRLRGMTSGRRVCL